MKKNFLALMLAVAVAALPSVAQTTDNTANDGDQSKTKKERVERVRKGGMHRGANPFAGISLSDEQKAQLKALGEKNKAERKEKAQQAAEKRQANDSIKHEKRNAERKAFLTDVKGILTADQYVTFLENFYLNAGNQMNAWQRNAKAHRPDKGDMKKGKGERPMPRKKAEKAQ